MIIELNGLAGVGKLTIGRELARMIDACLLDNHTIYNPAFATTEFRSPEFYDTVRAVRTIAYDRAAALPSAKHVIVTMAPGSDRAWGQDWQRAIRDLADRRGTRLLAVHLFCSDAAEHRRRVTSPERALFRKLTDPAELTDYLARAFHVLVDHADAVLELDVGALDPASAAQSIADWLDIA